MTTAPKITCRDFRQLRRNTLLGFAEIAIEELGLVIKDVALHSKNGSRWAAPPAKPQIKDGTVVIDDRGKPAYTPIIDFTSREARDRFSAAVIAAVLARSRDAFADEEVVL
jgi:hypothetical protein